MFQVNTNWSILIINLEKIAHSTYGISGYRNHGLPFSYGSPPPISSRSAIVYPRHVSAPRASTQRDISNDWSAEKYLAYLKNFNPQINLDPTVDHEQPINPQLTADSDSTKPVETKTNSVQELESKTTLNIEEQDFKKIAIKDLKILKSLLSEYEQIIQESDYHRDSNRVTRRSLHSLEFNNLLTLAARRKNTFYRIHVLMEKMEQSYSN